MITNQYKISKNHDKINRSNQHLQEDKNESDEIFYKNVEFNND